MDPEFIKLIERQIEDAVFRDLFNQGTLDVTKPNGEIVRVVMIVFPDKSPPRLGYKLDLKSIKGGNNAKS